MTLLLALCSLASTAAPAVQLPSDLTQTVLSSELDNPVALAVLPDDQILVAQQRGEVVLVASDGTTRLLWTVDSVLSDNERGLLGIAVHPDFTTNRWIYVYYTTGEPFAHNRLSRFRMPSDGLGAPVEPEEPLVDLPHLRGAIFHMGGALHFASDGSLFVAVGDHQDRQQAANLGSPFGKLHRFNDDGTIPADNPLLVPGTAQPSSIWSYGLRNPFSFAIQEVSDRIFVNDVGSTQWEEVNEAVPGGDFGWPTSEGPNVRPGQIAPLHAYAHGPECAVTGGAFVPTTGGVLPEIYRGQYLFADFCAGWIRQLDPLSGAVREFVTDVEAPTNLAVDSRGRVLYLSRRGAFVGSSAGELVRIEPRVDPNLLPNITQQPRSIEMGIGGTAVFSLRVENADRIVWQRDGVDLPSATDEELVLFDVQPEDDGASFRALVANEFGTVVSDVAILDVSENFAPLPEILTPTFGLTFDTGQEVSFAGRATDVEDGVVPVERLTWEVVLRHNEHFHPILLPQNGIDEGTFTMPDLDHGPGLSWLELRLTAEDLDGNLGTVRRAVVPSSLVDGSRTDLLTFHDDRFFMAVSFNDPTQGTVRDARAASLAPDSGGFWFFSPTNLELVVKVLDGRAINDSFWVMYGGLSDVEYVIRVWDAQTGAAWLYRNEVGDLAAGGDIGAFPEERSARDATRCCESESLRTESEPPSTEETTLTFLGARFELTLDWFDPRTGSAGTATAIPLTDESGLYWFFSPSNIEFAVKMLDAQALNQHAWLFFSGLTDLQLELHVRDTETGTERTYFKAPFEFRSLFDFQAFPLP